MDCTICKKKETFHFKKSKRAILESYSKPICEIEDKRKNLILHLENDHNYKKEEIKKLMIKDKELFFCHIGSNTQKKYWQIKIMKEL